MLSLAHYQRQVNKVAKLDQFIGAEIGCITTVLTVYIQRLCAVLCLVHGIGACG